VLSASIVLLPLLLLFLLLLLVIFFLYARLCGDTAVAAGIRAAVAAEVDHSQLIADADAAT